MPHLNRPGITSDYTPISLIVKAFVGVRPLSGRKDGEGIRMILEVRKAVNEKSKSEAKNPLSTVASGRGAGSSAGFESGLPQKRQNRSSGSLA